MQIMAEIPIVFCDCSGMQDCSWKRCHRATDHANVVTWPWEGRSKKTQVHTKWIQSVYRLLTLLNQLHFPQNLQVKVDFHGCYYTNEPYGFFDVAQLCHISDITYPLKNIGMCTEKCDREYTYLKSGSRCHFCVEGHTETGACRTM